MNADELTRLLDELATRLEGPARWTFELAVRQVIVEAGTYFVAAGVVAVLGSVSLWLASRWCFASDSRAQERYAVRLESWKTRKAADPDDKRDVRLRYEMPNPPSDEWYGWGWLCRLGVVALWALLALVSVGTGRVLLNPEYAALERLLSVIR